MTPSSQPHLVEIVDGVNRYPRTGIKVIISGAGIGGMFAGLECWRKGNDVDILEQNDVLSTVRH